MSAFHPEPPICSRPRAAARPPPDVRSGDLWPSENAPHSLIQNDGLDLRAGSRTVGPFFAEGSLDRSGKGLVLRFAVVALTQPI